ncbi:MAG: DivIVA domain-containing protein [Streptococcaceae bacterium]|nr:DivIVA domain-containing protein [Streptococcaceae bacterium]
MASYKLTPKEIFETDFATKMRGYDKEEVDEMLDNVISDYETFQAELLRLQEENEFLKNRVADLEKGVGKSVSQITADLDQTQRFDPFSQQAPKPVQPAPAAAIHPQPSIQIKEPSNFDLLKRINRLERAVFGPDSKFGDTTDLKN